MGNENQVQALSLELLPICPSLYFLWEFQPEESEMATLPVQTWSTTHQGSPEAPPRPRDRLFLSSTRFLPTPLLSGDLEGTPFPQGSHLQVPVGVGSNQKTVMVQSRLNCFAPSSSLTWTVTEASKPIFLVFTFSVTQVCSTRTLSDPFQT